MDGVQARPPKLANFNNGNVGYELLIRPNSVIENLGKYELNLTMNDNPISVSLPGVLNMTGLIGKFCLNNITTNTLTYLASSGNEQPRKLIYLTCIFYSYRRIYEN